MNEPNWKKMYAILCGAISDAIDVLPETAEVQPARRFLQSALDQAEELYLQAEPPLE
jgi:hypothetical protein